MRRHPAAWIVVAAAFGCSFSLPKAPAQSYYDVKYEAGPVQCPRSFGSPVEVWEFSAAAPYDRSDMVVTQGREVSFSHGHQWVDRPGVLVAARLMRDLNAGAVFPAAVSPRGPESAPLQLTGELYRFAWEKAGGSARAVFEADVILRRTGDPGEVLLHKRYDVSSEPVPSADDASTFARVMSGVVARFSDLLRHDLCSVASTPPGEADRR